MSVHLSFWKANVTISCRLQAKLVLLQVFCCRSSLKVVKLIKSSSVLVGKSPIHIRWNHSPHWSHSMYSHCSEVFTVSRDRLRRLMVDGNDVSFPDVTHSLRLDMQLRTCLSCQALPAKPSYTLRVPVGRILWPPAPSGHGHHE
ncbi:hypothetical protein OUZ56_010688 [Daphnia magna]|uniref:Uncharacterized protein n=1 Tax=Daphnia magna TaxID=35525 RepID=A0ABQ9YYG5_9CRUS|nr:hypothetical protein OUZ56_010688 [Daphnia magna]